MRYVFAVLGIIFTLTPIAYTFLKLANVIGPENPVTATIVGPVIWIVCIYIGVTFLKEARETK